MIKRNSQAMNVVLYKAECSLELWAFGSLDGYRASWAGRRFWTKIGKRNSAGCARSSVEAIVVNFKKMRETDVFSVNVIFEFHFARMYILFLTFAYCGCTKYRDFVPLTDCTLITQQDYRLSGRKPDFHLNLLLGLQ